MIARGAARGPPDLEIGGFFLSVFLRTARRVFIAGQVVLYRCRGRFRTAGAFLHTLLAARHLIVRIKAFFGDLDTIEIHIDRGFGTHTPRAKAAFQHFLNRARQAQFLTTPHFFLRSRRCRAR